MHQVVAVPEIKKMLNCWGGFFFWDVRLLNCNSRGNGLFVERTIFGANLRRFRVSTGGRILWRLVVIWVLVSVLLKFGLLPNEVCRNLKNYRNLVGQVCYIHEHKIKNLEEIFQTSNLTKQNRIYKILVPRGLKRLKI